MVRHHTLWSDPRLAEAYDLISDVLAAHATPEDGLSEIKGLLSEVEKTDQLLAGVLHERRAKATGAAA